MRSAGLDCRGRLNVTSRGHAQRRFAPITMTDLRDHDAAVVVITTAGNRQSAVFLRNATPSVFQSASHGTGAPIIVR
jgi:hypothetical protein